MGGAGKGLRHQVKLVSRDLGYAQETIGPVLESVLIEVAEITQVRPIVNHKGVVIHVPD